MNIQYLSFISFKAQCAHNVIYLLYYITFLCNKIKFLIMNKKISEERNWRLFPLTAFFYTARLAKKINYLR